MTTGESEPSGRPSSARLVHSLKIMSEIASADSEYCAVLHSAEDMSISEMEAEFRLYGEKIVNSIADIFTKYTGDDSHVCIKVCSSSPEVPTVASFKSPRPDVELPYVYSFWRDANSLGRRDRIDSRKHLGVYSLKENSGLIEAGRNGYWFNNKLSELGSSYKNYNKEWRKYYNATCITAIAPPSDFSSVHPNGFLCVDNMNGGFDDEGCRYILSIIANFLHYSMWMTAEIAYEKGSDDDESAEA